jgi:hypothetical protein
VNGQHWLWSRARVRALSLMLVAALLLPGTTASQKVATPPLGSRLLTGTVPLPPGAEVIAEQPAVAARSYPRLEPQLAELYESAALSKGRSLNEFAKQDHIDVAAGMARVILEMDVDPQARQDGSPAVEKVALPGGRTARIEYAAPTAIRSDLAAAVAATGASYELAVGDLMQALAPFRSLKALSEIPGVRRVRQPYPAQALVGAQATEGVSLAGASAWHTAGHDGTGVAVAVFDFGFTGWAALQTSGDLPADPNLVRKDFSAEYAFSPDTADYEHGAACAEIAYDMAPGSTMYLYAWSTDAEFALAVDDYRNNVSGKRVATMSIGWVNAGPYDGTSSLSGPAAKVNQAQASGIFWANSAGNSQKAHYSWTSAQYGTGDYVAFGSGNIQGIGPSSASLWNISGGTVLRMYLEWNDWNASRTGNQSHVDYDLYLFRYTAGGGTWTQVASSTGDQCGSSAEPTEAIEYTVPSGSAKNYGIVIARYATGCTNNFGHWMQLYTFNSFWSSGTGMANSFWYVNNCNSLQSPADADGAVAVGASFWAEDSSSTYNYGLETFSSLGPRNASGGANPGTAVNKPDVVAPDGVSTATYGASNGVAFRTSGASGFFGTSGAAPHVAGLAATVWERFPAYTLAELRTYVQSNASFKADGTCGGSGSGNQNNTFGWGRIDLPVEQAIAGLVATNDSPTLLGTPTTLTATVTAGSNVGYAWDFGDGALGSGVTASHTYAAAGIYTAVVTATNGVSTLTATTGVTVTELGTLGDVNGDGLADSTDALIILSADAGINTSQFCPMKCGNVNGDGYVDSTDALIVLSYDAAMSVPYPVGQPGCPFSVTQPPGCAP